MNKLFIAVLGTLLITGLTACGGTDSRSKAQTIPTGQAQQANGQSTSDVTRIDLREVLPLNPLQREYILIEMHGLLAATQGVVEALANEDLSAVQDAASAMGMNALHTVENEENMAKLKLGEALPPNFMKLGSSVHKDFDEIAQMAADKKSIKEIQLKLAGTMKTCITCHTAYQIPNP